MLVDESVGPENSVRLQNQQDTARLCNVTWMSSRTKFLWTTVVTVELLLLHSPGFDLRSTTRKLIQLGCYQCPLDRLPVQVGQVVFRGSSTILRSD